MGWDVITLWECELTKRDNKRLDQLLSQIKKKQGNYNTMN